MSSPDATPRLVGQGVAATSVADGDVTIGVNAARQQLEASVGPLEPELTLATSSAAGGLRMTVHGLTQRMTAMAAREAALGAGAVVEYQTAGRLRDHDLREIEAVRPNLILLAGGVEGGDCDTVLFNAGELAELEARPIVVYAGNSRRLQRGAGAAGAGRLPGPAHQQRLSGGRRARHRAGPRTSSTTRSRSTSRTRRAWSASASSSTASILPTPGAVLIAAELLAEDVGDLVVVDVGGATTDVHSITDGSPEIAALMIEPQPHSKRTVEGDLGTFVSAQHVVEMLAAQERPVRLPPPLPTTPEEIAAALTLTHFAAVTGVQRHAGQLAHLYTPTGRQTVARGRDLTACRLVIGTGGALTRLPGGEAVLGGHARQGRRRRTPAAAAGRARALSTATTSSPAAARCCSTSRRRPSLPSCAPARASEPSDPPAGGQIVPSWPRPNC